MMTRNNWLGALMVLIAVSLLVTVPTSAHRWDECNGWEEDDDWGNQGRYCEIRQLTLPGSGSVAVDAGRNGGIHVTGHEQSDVTIEARVQVWESSESEAMELASQVEILTAGNRVYAEGPSENGWAVSYRLRVPHKTDLDLEAHNGGISIEEVEGRLRAETHNGGLSLSALAGDVRAETTNGGVRVDLVGEQWQGSGLDVETRNGGVHLSIPENYSADLETGTVNGRIDLEFPVTVEGRISRSIETTLGEGGAPIRVKTRNGGVSVRRN